VTIFAAYVARILLCESCKFGEKIFYSNWDNEFFLMDCFLLVHPVQLHIYLLFASYRWSFDRWLWASTVYIITSAAPIGLAVSVLHQSGASPSVCLSVCQVLSAKVLRLAKWQHTSRRAHAMLDGTRADRPTCNRTSVRFDTIFSVLFLLFFCQNDFLKNCDCILIKIWKIVCFRTETHY